MAQLPRLVGPYFPTQGSSGVLIRGLSHLSEKIHCTIQCDVASWYQIKNCISTCFIYFSDFCLFLECVGRQTVDLPFCSKPGWFISHKLRGSFLALPTSHYLRDFLSLALSIILGCMFLSHDMESVILLSRVQQKWEKEKKPRKLNVLERCISFVSRTQQTVWNLVFSALTWLFLGHSLPALSRGMHGFCRDSASGLLLGKCGENPNSCLSVCWRALSALWSFKSS